VLTEVAERFAGHPGELAHFAWPVTRAQALEALHAVRPRQADAVKLVVVGGAEGTVAVSVGQILDVLPAESPLQAALSAAGVTGTVALAGQATEVLDLAGAAAGV